MSVSDYVAHQFFDFRTPANYVRPLFPMETLHYSNFASSVPCSPSPDSPRLPQTGKRYRYRLDSPIIDRACISSSFSSQKLCCVTLRLVQTWPRWLARLTSNAISPMPTLRTWSSLRRSAGTSSALVRLSYCLGVIHAAHDCEIGQVYQTLLQEREEKGINDVAISRVEQLSPFPYDLVRIYIP